MKKILVLDNYDSFTYNLVQYAKEVSNYQIDVFRNDEIQLNEISKYDGIILSPGPGLPNEAGLLMPIIEKYCATKRIFGVCLGEQAIAEAFGAKLENLKHVYHGVATDISITKSHYLFENMPKRLTAGRYHSWVVSKNRLPECLCIEAEDAEGNIMAISHKQYDVCGVQFHPESVLTPQGKQIIRNWLNRFEDGNKSLLN